LLSLARRAAINGNDFYLAPEITANGGFVYKKPAAYAESRACLPSGLSSIRASPKIYGAVFFQNAPLIHI
jgi:hypothetical protein